MPLAKWTHDMIKVGLLALVFFALLRVVAAKWGGEFPAFQKAVGWSVGA